MLSQEVINTANQLPPMQQQLVTEFIEFLAYKYLSIEPSNKPIENSETKNNDFLLQ
ncbi:MAG: DUF2281 domain-containing protein [Moraxellaceae bacterium]|nr:DUF2281 domain-containing protein [Moraxellaceae bacterium]